MSQKKLFSIFMTFIIVIALLNYSDYSRAEEEPDVIIVGAGLSGLTTAYNLKKYGISYKILEWDSRVGGRVRTANYEKEGVKVEAGLAEFWASNPAFEMIKELNVPYHVEGSYSSVVMKNKLYPLQGNDNVAYLKAFMGEKGYKGFENWDKLVGNLLKKIKDGKVKEIMYLKDISFADWCKKNGLLENTLEIIRITIEPEIGTSWENISALDGIAEWHIFLDGGEDSYVLDNGNVSFIEALADSVGRENIMTDMQVTRLKNHKDKVEVESRNRKDFKNMVFNSKYVVSTVPLYRLAEIQFEPKLTDKKQQAIYSQNWGAYFTAHVFMDKKADKYWTNKDGSEFLPILSDGPLGVIYSSTPGKNDPDTVVINLLITGSHAEGFNYRGTLVDNARQQINEAFEKLFPGISKYIKKHEFVRYHPRAIASWPVGRSRFDELSNEIRKPHGRIYFGGDFTESSHSDGAVLSALRVVNDIKKELNK